MQHWTEVALGSAWPSHGLTTSGINCQPMARLSNFSPGRRTVRHSSQVGKIKPTPLNSKGWISINNGSDRERFTFFLKLFFNILTTAVKGLLGIEELYLIIVLN